MKLIDLGERFTIYVTEQSFLISLTSLIALYFKIKAAFLGFFVAYKIDFDGGFLHIFDTYYGLLNLLILFLISFIYYSTESLTNKGVAETIFKLKIINKYNFNRKKMLKLLLIRDLIKSFFISEIISSLYIIKKPKLLQSYYDYKNNFVSIKNIDYNKKSIFLQYFYSSIIIYYSIFFILLIIYTFITPVSPLSSSGPVKTGLSFHYWPVFNEILHNNITLDVFEYMIGGLSLFAGTFIELFSSNVYETTIIASLDSAHGFSTFVKYILPQFFPETLGYVFGIGIALLITDLILTFIQSMIRNEKSDYFNKRSYNIFYVSWFYLILSIVLIVLGALIESALGIYNF